MLKVLLLWLSPFAFCAQLCPLYFQYLLPHASENQKLATDLEAVGTDAQRAQEFLAKWGKPVVTVGGTSVDGQAAKFVLPRSPSENSGHRNDGIYFFKRQDSPRVLKTFDPELENDRFALMSFMRAMEGASLGERLGGPRVFQFGRTSKGQYYIEMERIFPEGNPCTVKEWFSGWNKAGSGMEKIEPSQEKKEIVFRRMAELEIEALSKNIAPNDPDFLVSESGEVRWIDSHNWTRWDWRNPAANNPRRGSYGWQKATFLARFAASKPEAARQYVEVFLSELKRSGSMTDQEKQVLLEELFFSPHHERFSKKNEIRQALVATGLQKNTDTREPYAVIEDLYQQAI